MSEPKTGSRPWKRTRLIINPGFQFRMIGYVAAVAVILVVILAGADAYFIHRFYEAGRVSGLPAGHPYFQLLDEQRKLQLQVFILATGAMLAVLFFGGLLISHRIAGPIFRICKHLDSFSEGDELRDVSLRDGDFFMELAEAYNRSLVRFREIESRGVEQNRPRIKSSGGLL